MKSSSQRIEARVTPRQKKKITQISEKCGLPLSEYIRQRALGYSPKTVLPDAFYSFHAKLCKLCNSVDGKVSADVEEQLLELIDEIQSKLLLPGKETAAQIKSEMEGDTVTWHEDIICGSFLVCADDGEGNDISLADRQIAYFTDRFQEPEFYSDEEAHNIEIEIRCTSDNEEFLRLPGIAPEPDSDAFER